MLPLLLMLFLRGVIVMACASVLIKQGFVVCIADIALTSWGRQHTRSNVLAVLFAAICQGEVSKSIYSHGI